ncbi:MAG TPA: fatty acid--CoA ligase, partial [Haliea salexigens]|nr:fatty acid--CoA ligase [Haliea salexigens]
MPITESDQRTLPQVVAATARALPERVAISDGPVSLTYAELDAARLRAAAAFLAAGLAHGERIAIWAPNMWQWIVAAMGAQTIGGVLVPLNTRLKGAEAGFILRRSGARWLFTVGEFLGMCYPAMLAHEDLP